MAAGPLDAASNGAKELTITIQKNHPESCAEDCSEDMELNRRKAMTNQETQSVMARLSIVFFAALVVCNLALGQEVRSNYVPGTDFTKFHTYKWVTIAGGQHPNQIVDEQIKQAVDAQLAKKGFTKATGDTADLAVGYQVAVDQQKQWNAYGTGGGWGWGGGMATATSSTIDVGTLVLDMYDPSSKKLVWTGRATKTIEASKNPEKNQEHLDKAMEKLLKDFPPKQK